MGDERVRVEGEDIVFYVECDQDAFGVLPTTGEPIYPPKCFSVVFPPRATRPSYDSFLKLDGSRGWKETAVIEKRLEEFFGDV